MVARSLFLSLVGIVFILAALAPDFADAGIRKHSRGQKSTQIAEKKRPKKNHAKKTSIKRSIEKKYAKLLRKMKKQQVREEDRLIDQLARDSTLFPREEFKRLASKYRLEEERLEYAKYRELCERARTSCEKVGRMTASQDRSSIPAYARDSGFRYLD